MSNQLVKRDYLEGYRKVFPKTFVDAIKDRDSGMSLAEIIQGFNMYFLSYNGNKALTRCSIPKSLRKEGLWITYVLYDHTVITEWYNSDNIEDEAFGSDDNWRIASNILVGDISVSSDGYWVIKGEKTTSKAQGETGITPLLRIGSNNKLQVTYNEGKEWRDISDYIVPKFRWAQGSGNTIGHIQISMDLGATWNSISGDITNNIKISKYIGINEALPTSGIAEGTIYMKGPYYDENDINNDNPIYRMWVYAWKDSTLAWQDNGEFTSISAGVVQEIGDSETEVMSQKAVTEKLTELESKVGGTIEREIIAKGAYHSSNDDQIAVRIKQGDNVSVLFEAISATIGKITLYVFYEDGHSDQYAMYVGETKVIPAYYEIVKLGAYFEVSAEGVIQCTIEGGELYEIKEDITTLSTAVAQNAERVSALSEKLNDVVTISPNMFDGTYQNGYWGSSFTASTSYFSTNLIPVKEGVSYRYNPDYSTFGAQAARIALYDSEKNLLYTALAATEGTEAIYTPSSGVAYVSCNIGKLAKVSTFIFARDSEYPDEYVPYRKELSSDIKVSPDSIIGDVGDNILRNKKIALNGDSICYGAGYVGGYGKIIAERNGMTYENIAKSGGTISAETYQEGSPRHWISRTIENMSADADYIILEGGVNDSSLGVPLGQLSEGYDATLDDTTFYGAFESMLKQLLIRFAGKKVGYIIVHQMSAQYRAINDKEGSYYWAAKTCCEKWGVPYCDLNISVPAFGLYKSESSPLYALRTEYTYNGDGWHPNEAGYIKYYCDKIESWMRSL